MTKTLKLFAVLALLAAPLPVAAGTMQDMDTACKLEIENRIGGYSDARSARFKKQRGSGRVKRFIYALTYDDARSDAVCFVTRSGVDKVVFDKDIAVKIAAAEAG